MNSRIDEDAMKAICEWTQTHVPVIRDTSTSIYQPAIVAKLVSCLRDCQHQTSSVFYSI